MKRIFQKWFVGLQIGWIALAGCHPTQPYFIRERGDLAHYLDQSQKIEYPDLEINPIPEATKTLEPLTLDNQKFEFLDLTLEQCISYALVNSKLIRTTPGSQGPNPDMASAILSTQGAALSTIYDPAIVATATNSQQVVVDQSGNRVQSNGSVKATQVGGVEDALSEFDAQFSSFFSYNNTDRPRNVGSGNVFNPQDFRARDSTGQMAISKRTASGNVVTFRSQTLYGYNNIPVQTPASLNNFGRAVPSDYTQIFEAQIQQPLLRGRGALVNRIPVVLARINEDISLVDFNERVRNLVRDVEYAYWELYQSYWNVENARIARDSAARAYHIAYHKMQKGASETPEAQAKVTYHEFQAQLDAALGGGANNQAQDNQGLGLFGREQNLRLLMGWGATDGRLIRPSDKPSIGMAQFDFNDSVNEAFNRNVDLIRQRWIIKQKELELVSAKNQILPDLDVSLIYRWLGVGGSLLDKTGGNGPFPPSPGQPAPSAFEVLNSGDYQEAAFRVDFTPTAFGARRASAAIRNSQLELARAHCVLEEKEVAASFALTQTLRKLNSNYAQMLEQLAALTSAQRLVALQEERFNVGEGSSEQVMDLLLRAQQSRANAGRNYIRALAEYNKSIVEVHTLKGSLLEYNNITLEEGLWPDKAYWDATERARERDAATFVENGASRPRVVSRGEVSQMTGTANSAATPKRVTASGTPSAAPASSEPKKSEPAVEKQNQPLKKASAESKPKFDWGS